MDNNTLNDLSKSVRGLIGREHHASISVIIKIY